MASGVWERPGGFTGDHKMFDLNDAVAVGRVHPFLGSPKIPESTGTLRGSPGPRRRTRGGAPL